MRLLLRYFILLLIFVVCCFTYRNTVYKNPIYSYSDAEGYYMYLPAWFIYKNYKDIPVKTEKEFSKLDNGNYFNKYTFGVALMQSPFFLSAHILNTCFDWYPADGYSKIYQKSIFLSAVFYCFMGLLILYNLIRDITDSYCAVIVTGTAFLGTNLLFYTLHASGMSHVYSFFLISLLVSITYRQGLSFLQKSLLIYSIILGLLILIRPLNVLVLIYPLALMFREQSSWEDRFSFIKKNFVKGILLILPACILLSLNMIEWSKMRGSLQIYSYTNESFIYWNRPKMLRVLLDIQNGLFIYAPAMLLSVAGIVKFYRSRYEVKIFFWMLVVFTYFFGSWWAWWFGGAYGQRCYVDLLVFLCVPIGLLVKHLKQKKEKLGFYLMNALLVVCIFYSLRMTQLYVSPWDGPSWTFGRYISEVAKAFYLK